MKPCTLAAQPRHMIQSVHACPVHHNGAVQGMRTMYVADVDMSRPTTSPPKSRQQVTVPDFRTTSRDFVNGEGELGLQQNDYKTKALALDNQALKMEVIRCKTLLTEQKADAAALKATIAERDRTAQVNKAEVMAARVQMSEIQDLLQVATERLHQSNVEKAEYRQQLLNAEHELDITQAELSQWSDGLVELKTVMEGLDDNLSDLVGTQQYQAVMQSVLEDSNDSAGDSVDYYDGAGSGVFETMDDDHEEAFTQALRDLRHLSQEVLDEAHHDKLYFQ